MFIRALSLACYSSSLCYRLYPGSSCRDTVESIEELPVKLKTWKAEMERKVLSVNIGKTKIVVSGLNLNILKKKKTGKNPCGDCQRGVGRNAVFCGGCLSWIVASKAPCAVIPISAVLAAYERRVT